MKHYLDVKRYGASGTAPVFSINDDIVIQEKIDGANASFKVEDGKIRAFSRSTEVTNNQNLRGFFAWTQTLDPTKLLEGVVYFGEWTAKHKLDYGENLNKFYLFDIFNLFLDEYVAFSMVRDEASRLNLNLVPVLYEGKFVSFEHLQTFIGQSQLREYGEGIVVKNVAYKNRFGDQCFVKLVTDEFREMVKQKAPKDPNARPSESIFISETLTDARVDKLLHKMVDNNLLPEDFGLEEMPIIMKHLGGQVYADIMKEEAKALERHLKKSIGRVLPIVVKNIIANKQVEAV